MSAQRIGQGAPQGAARQRAFGAGAVRFARPEDAARIADMANALAEITTGKPGKMTEADVQRDLIGDRELGCMVGVRAGQAAAYALYSAAYETAEAARGIYLSDLYVAPHARGHGLGTELMRALARICDRGGGRFIWWVTTQDNPGARAFYDRLGAVRDPVDARAVFEAPFDMLLKG